MSQPPPVSTTRLALQPRNWLTTLGLSCLFVLAHMPIAIQRGVASGIGGALYKLAKRRRRITEINLKLAFPELDEQSRQRRSRQHFSDMAFSLLELGTNWFREFKGQSHRFHYHGLENFEAAREKGGVLLITAHFASWELTGNYVGQDLGICASYRPHENPLIDHMLKLSRERHFKRLYAREDIRGMIRELRNGGVLWYASDQNFGHKGSVFVDFFGVPAATNTASSRIAGMTGCQVVPFFPARRDDGSYELWFEPALENFPSGDPAEDASRINAAIERAVERAPSQYFWSHRRYKDRPDNGKRFY